MYHLARETIVVRPFSFASVVAHTVLQKVTRATNFLLRVGLFDSMFIIFRDRS